MKNNCIRPIASANQRSRSENARERGSVFVELALISLVMFCMLIAVVDFGQFLYIHQALTESARAAVRYGAASASPDMTAVRNMVLYGQPTADSSPSFGLQASNVQVSTPGASTSDYRLVVLVTNYSYAIFTPMIAGSYSGPNILAAQPLGIPYN